MAKRSIVGDVINFRGLVYAPVNEMGVVALFAKISEELGFIIEEVKGEYPDCIARRQVDRGWERVGIEFEYRSKNFKQHKHDSKGCELIVCWEHDWETCPVPVISLKQFIADAQATVSGPLNRVRIAEPIQVRRVVVTAGAIRNGYVNLKPIDDFWPEECLGENTETAQKHLLVEFEGIGRITTDISGRHKTFRGTVGQTKQFYEKHKLDDGDEVEILRVAEYEYKVRPAK